MSKVETTPVAGSCIISEEVIATIACAAAVEVDGVASMGNRPADIRGLITSPACRSVKVAAANDETVLDVYVNLYANRRIPDVGTAVQKKVKAEVQAMTGKPVIKVNVHIAGVVFEDAVKKSADAEEQ